MRNRAERLALVQRWIAKRFKQMYRVAGRGISPLYTRELQEPHRLHKRSFFSCRKHNCTVSREDEKVHRKKIKEKY